MALQLENTFTLDLPRDQVWTLLNDIERIAPCVPGARLTEAEGDEYRGSVKIKLGPITAEYKGAATIKEADEAAGRMLVVGKGRDVHGQGNAAASMIVILVADGASATRINVVTDVQVAGKVASLGKSVMQDVAARIVDQFVANLKERLGAEQPAPPSPPSETPPPIAENPAMVPQPDPALAPLTLPASAPAPDGGDVRQIESNEAEALDVLNLGVGALLKQPAVWIGGAVALALILFAVFHR